MAASQKGELIGQRLLRRGLLTEPQLHLALASQCRSKKRLGEESVALGFMTDEDLAKFLAEEFDLPYLDLADCDEFDASAVELISESFALQHTVLITKKEDDLLTVAMADPMDMHVVDAIQQCTRCRTRRMVSSRTAIHQAIDRCYHNASRIAQSMNRVISMEQRQYDDLLGPLSVSAADNQLQRHASEAPVIQFIDLLLMRAVRERASDIHLEPEEQGICVRMRIDGVLDAVTIVPKSMMQAVITRIKLLGSLDIAEHRLPQDGRFEFRAFDRTIDVRLSCVPTIHGETLVLRLLDQSALILDLASLGFEAGTLDTFRRALQLPHGLVILTGPTGSGKTTTLYAALSSLNSPTKNIITVEDPVEYRLKKINQIHARADIGLTFAAGLRAILRQDPDVIMVGEIRDSETAEICIRASLTGHLVLSTLHTNDSIAAISRLVDLGIEPYLLTATLGLVMAQRLVRRICVDCRQPWEPPQEMLDRLIAMRRNSHQDKAIRVRDRFLRGAGCKRCGGTGYFGRIAVYEQFVLTEPVKALIGKGVGELQIAEAAQREGFQTLLQSALHKVSEGVTTLDEAFSLCASQADLLG